LSFFFFSESLNEVFLSNISVLFLPNLMRILALFFLDFSSDSFSFSFVLRGFSLTKYMDFLSLFSIENFFVSRLFQSISFNLSLFSNKTLSTFLSIFNVFLCFMKEKKLFLSPISFQSSFKTVPPNQQKFYRLLNSPYVSHPHPFLIFF